MDRAHAFLDRFRATSGDASPLTSFADDPDGFGAAIENAPEALAAAFADAVTEDHGAPVLLQEDCFASAACDRHGAMVITGARFESWFDGVDPFDAVVRHVSSERPNVSLLADDRNGRPVALAAGTIAVARNWPLDEKVRTALINGQAEYAVVAFRPGPMAWTAAARAYGLTQAESLLVGALARHGDLQRAARERDIAYETARKFVAAAMRKTSSHRQTELIHKTLMVAAGDVPRSDSLAAQITDLFGLTTGQADLTVLVAHGCTREEAARRLGMSEHRAKSDLKVIFQTCGVANAADLSRIVVEIDALMGLASACDVTVGSAGEPLRMVPRTWAEGQIAVADHGPAGAVPLLVFHSTVNGRHHPRSFVSALRGAGYRPIMIERPGFGLSDRAPGDPVEAAVSDVCDVMAAMQIEAPLAIGRCTAASYVAAAGAAEGLFAGGVMLWPEAPSHFQQGRTRMTDRARAIFARYPAMAEAFTRVLCRRTNSQSIERLWRKSADGIVRDEAVLDDPLELADIIRATKQASVGMYGFMNESLWLTRAPKPPVVRDADGWTLFFGEGYERYDITDAVPFWCDAMTGATVEMVDGSAHFLHIAHCDRIIAALDRACETLWAGKPGRDRKRLAI